MRLNEIFDKALPWEWDKNPSDTNMVAFFQVDDAEYNVEFDSSMEGQWGFDFGRSESNNSPVSEITGTGNQYAVFATVVDIVKEFISQNDPNHIVFSADRNEPSRIKLYNRMLKMFPKDKYDVKITNEADSAYYDVTKKGVQQHATQ